VRHRRFRGGLAAILVGLLLATAAPVSAASAGWLDPGFGRGGTVDLRPLPDHRKIDAVAVLRSPRGVVVLSQARLAPGGGEDEDGYYVHALTTTGARDAQFGMGSGVVVGATPIGRPWAIVPRSGGFAVISTTADLGIGQVRVTAHLWNGQQNPAASSISAPLVMGSLGFTHAAAMPDGGIRICTTVPPNSETESGIWLLGLDANGDPDETVGPQGLRHLELGTAASCNGIVADTVGRLVVAGSGRVDGRRAAFVGRYSAAGEPDATFGTGGSTTLLGATREFTAYQLLRLGTAGFLLGGQAIDPGAAPLAYTARLTANGLKDAAYGFGGVYRYPGAAGSVLRALDGVGGDVSLLGIARRNADGSISETLQRIRSSTGRLDPAFGRHGVVGVFHEAVDTTIDATGRTVTVGSRVSSATSVLVQGRVP
jgi:hypothetical protein